MLYINRKIRRPTGKYIDVKIGRSRDCFFVLGVYMMRHHQTICTQHVMCIYNRQVFPMLPYPQRSLTKDFSIFLLFEKLMKRQERKKKKEKEAEQRQHTNTRVIL